MALSFLYIEGVSHHEGAGQVHHRSARAEAACSTPMEFSKSSPAGPIITRLVPWQCGDQELTLSACQRTVG